MVLKKTWCFLFIIILGASIASAYYNQTDLAFSIRCINDSIDQMGNVVVNNYNVTYDTGRCTFNDDNATFLMINDSPTIDFSDSITICAGYNITTEDGDVHSIFTKWNTDGRRSYMIQDQYVNSTLQYLGFFHGIGNAYDEARYTWVPTRTINTNIFMCGRWSNLTDGRLRIFINGTNMDLSWSSQNYTPLYDGDMPLFIGQSYAADRQFAGQLWNAFAYGRALSDDEMSQAYEDFKAGIFPDQVQDFPGVHINESLNNTEFAVNNPHYISFNFTHVHNETSNCTLFFDGDASGTNTSLSYNTTHEILINQSIPPGSYNIWINCTDELSDENKSLVLKVFFVEYEEEPSAQVVIGGGGGSTQTFKSDEEYGASIDLCIQNGGNPVNIKGTIYCEQDEKYTEISSLLEKRKTIKLFGVEIYDVGYVISKEHPDAGWMIFIFIVGIILITLREDTKSGKARAYAKAKVKKYQSKTSNHSGRRRTDGGYY